MVELDPIEEIRKRRRDLFEKKYGGSIDSLVDSAQEWEKQHSEKLIDLAGQKRRAVDNSRRAA